MVSLHSSKKQVAKAMEKYRRLTVPCGSVRLQVHKPLPLWSENCPSGHGLQTKQQWGAPSRGTWLNPGRQLSLQTEVGTWKQGAEWLSRDTDAWTHTEKQNRTVSPQPTRWDAFQKTFLSQVRPDCRGTVVCNRGRAKCKFPWLYASKP